MKTPREILLGKHQRIEPKLDAMREQFLEGVASVQAEQTRRRDDDVSGWPQFIRMVRWHLAGLSAVWALIVLLRVTSTAVESLPLAQAKAEPPRTAIALLKENRRQIMELGDAPFASIPVMAPPASKSRRSCLQRDWDYA